MINYEKYVTIGAKLCFQDIENPAVAFVGNLFNNRTAVAKKIVNRHADFVPMYEKIRSNICLLGNIRIRIKRPWRRLLVLVRCIIR